MSQAERSNGNWSAEAFLQEISTSDPNIQLFAGLTQEQLTEVEGLLHEKNKECLQEETEILGDAQRNVMQRMWDWINGNPSPIARSTAANEEIIRHRPTLERYANLHILALQAKNNALTQDILNTERVVDGASE